MKYETAIIRTQDGQWEVLTRGCPEVVRKAIDEKSKEMTRTGETFVFATYNRKGNVNGASHSFYPKTLATAMTRKPIVDVVDRTNGMLDRPFIRERTFEVMEWAAKRFGIAFRIIDHLNDTVDVIEPDYYRKDTIRLACLFRDRLEQMAYQVAEGRLCAQHVDDVIDSAIEKYKQYFQNREHRAAPC